MSINSLDGYSFFISGNTTSTAGTSTPLKLYDRSDEITSRFYYDALGRLVVSQNAKQFYTGAALSKNVYSYTLYDAIGRITEVGEITSTSPIETAYNGSKMDQSLFNSWINQSGSSRKQVTKTFYDQAVFTSTPIGTAPYLRHRVSSTTYTENFTGNINAYNSATHYAYDVHGNVNKIVNDLPELEEYEARYKVTEYEYDVLSGKVNQVIFQKNKNDQFAHHYEYDNLNRLTGVYTSQKSSVFYGEQYHSLWQKDAKYSYYLHGPLARIEIGNDRVQGLDYAYNLQGWLKGVNSATLLAERDMGKDGCNTCATNLNSNFAKDEMGFVLGYFEGDYTPVTTFASNAYFDISTKDPSQTNSELLNEKKDLFNGNISYMTTAIGKFMEGLDTKPNSMVYGYDQLNRLLSTKRFNNINVIDNFWEQSGQSNTDYNETFSYDENGNILSLRRNGIDAGGTNEMDVLRYRYESINENQKKNTNKLLSVADDITNYNLTGTSDFPSGQSFITGSLNGNNYQYDEIGNLVKDLQEEIEEISWNVYGKISKIKRKKESTKPDLEFAYDASGNRIKKIVKPVGSEIWDITYYLRDAQGNVMSTYSLKENSLKQDRLYIYGSSRLGELVADAKNQDVCSISISEDELLNSREQAIDGFIRNLFSNLQDPAFTEQIVSYWNVKWNDYFSQTGTMPPSTNTIQTHQFNWNAWVEWMCKMKCYENLNSEVFGIWENHWNGRLQAFYNGSITCGYVECPETYTELLTEWTENLNNEVIPNMQAHNFVSSCSVQNNVYVKGSRRYELSNHLGNVLAVVSDRKIESDEDYFYAGLGSGYKFENGTYIADVDGEYRQNSGQDGIISSYSAEVISANDYYAFGSLMPGRSFSGGEYKFGFQGQIEDAEISGEGNTSYFEYRISDNRLGRFLSIDPLEKDFPWNSPFAFSENRVISAIELEGLEAVDINGVSGPWSVEHLQKQAEDAGGNFEGGEFQLSEPFVRKIESMPKLPFSIGIQNGKTVEVISIEVTWEESGVGQAGTLESFTPIWGPGRNALDDFQNDRYVSGSLNSISAVSDCFLLYSLYKGAAQGGIKALGKNMNDWKSWRKFYGKEKFAKPYQDVHHWAFEKGGKSGEGFSWWAKNQMWNLKPMTGRSINGTFYEGTTIHMALHGKSSVLKLGTDQMIFYRFIYTPTWFKAGLGSVPGHFNNEGFGFKLRF